ncbi:bifunctional 4-hydroxy-2-oxoglutarate aldolase/2-dehydro-3-deoxy-phosphogluconate aldolase [Aerococcus tenax]|uniref:bifunctional 4-hydroxy-2-oxoglutarate aldolase/2-dehydro-3-deoxy-phosphogluconate aldolase n=1 Tax=Aerococcus tenax TaxID=3078812 RepID=UPI0018A7BF47|nr:bifunctional 4-hydroxy-2-oxoglutarate aldolase/2-dehydro-3-deoxy-phosphogluconate aldolase [Aerococcus tenax]
MDNKNIIDQLGQEQLLPLYTVNDMSYLDKMSEILLDNNLHFIEITYRSQLASQAIKYLSEAGQLIVGAGTVRTVDQAKEAINNGAKFIVTPGFSDKVVEYCLNQEIPIVPGAVTPSEITKAHDYGINIVKFFPANVYGGLKAIKALSGPFYDMKFVPTGGVNADNYKELLSCPNVFAVGGSFIISEKEIAKDNGGSANQALKHLVKQ